jgi:hypothetical protein
MSLIREEMIAPGDLMAAVAKATTKRGNWIDTDWQGASTSYAYASGRCPVCGGTDWQERKIGKPSSHLDVFGRCSGCGHGVHYVQGPVWDRSWD